MQCLWQHALFMHGQVCVMQGAPAIQCLLAPLKAKDHIPEAPSSNTRTGVQVMLFTASANFFVPSPLY
eukprot:733742-Pelagomonas_calceolata.AAC.1